MVGRDWHRVTGTINADGNWQVPQTTRQRVIVNVQSAQLLLLEQLQTLLSRARRISDHQHEKDRDVPKDWDDLAQYRQGDEVVSALDQRTRYDVSLIRAALVRIERGGWGHCVRCHDPIAADRLASMPATPLCADCANTMESHAE